MMFFGMLLSAVLGFIIGMLCKTVIDSKTMNYMREQLNSCNSENIEVIEIKDTRSANSVDYFKPF